MKAIHDLELLYEGIRDEIYELDFLLQNSDSSLLKVKKVKFQKQLENIISNLKGLNDSIYVLYEDLNCEDMDKLQRHHDIMYDILNEKLSHEDKVYMKIKYGIEFF